MLRELRQDVEDELARLTRALEESSDGRSEILAVDPAEGPSGWDRRAAAGVVHECYTGMENVLKRVAKRIDRDLPQGALWHADLLQQVARSTPARPAVIGPSLLEQLSESLGFRHVARVRYSFDLDWPLLRSHLDRLPGLICQFSGEVRAFLDAMDDRADRPAP